MRQILHHNFIAAVMLCFFTQAARSQNVANPFVVDRLESYFVGKEYIDVQGSAFLNDKWNTGLVRFANGKSANTLLLKYDQVKDILLFQDPKNPEQMLRFADPVAEFKLDTSKNVFLLFKNGFEATDGHTKGSFYQVLFEGKASLLKRASKLITESRPFNSATIIRSIVEQSSYYLCKNNVPVKLKKDKKQILAALGGHTPDLENYIKANGLNLKEEDDLTRLIGYYNSL